MNRRIFWLATTSLILLSTLTPPVSAATDSATQTSSAVEGVIRGRVQKVGFRALIFRQAIRYNLGGMIENFPDGSVHFALQGSPELLKEALTMIRKGTAKAQVNDVEIKPAPVQNGVVSAVVKGWTSSTRDFQHPVDLVYPLRVENQPVSEEEAHRIYKQIIRSAMASRGTQTNTTGKGIRRS